MSPIVLLLQVLSTFIIWLMNSSINGENHNMNQDDFVIFAELNRDKFDEILQTLMEHFKDIQYGRQGDDWIWVHIADDKIEIDSFFSMNLEVKGKHEHYTFALQVLHALEADWILQVFDPPKIDKTR